MGYIQLKFGYQDQSLLHGILISNSLKRLRKMPLTLEPRELLLTKLIFKANQILETILMNQLESGSQDQETPAHMTQTIWLLSLDRRININILLGHQFILVLLCKMILMSQPENGSTDQDSQMIQTKEKLKLASRNNSKNLLDLLFTQDIWLKCKMILMKQLENGSTAQDSLTIQTKEKLRQASRNNSTNSLDHLFTLDTWLNCKLILTVQQDNGLMDLASLMILNSKLLRRDTKTNSKSLQSIQFIKDITKTKINLNISTTQITWLLRNGIVWLTDSELIQ